MTVVDLLALLSGIAIAWWLASETAKSQREIGAGLGARIAVAASFIPVAFSAFVAVAADWPLVIVPLSFVPSIALLAFQRRLFGPRRPAPTTLFVRRYRDLHRTLRRVGKPPSALEREEVLRKLQALEAASTGEHSELVGLVGEEIRTWLSDVPEDERDRAQRRRRMELLMETLARSL